MFYLRSTFLKWVDETLYEFHPFTSEIADQKKMAASDSRRRVKLYLLDEKKIWDDRGTGHVSSAYVEKLKGMSLLVRSETDG